LLVHILSFENIVLALICNLQVIVKHFTSYLFKFIGRIYW